MIDGALQPCVASAPQLTFKHQISMLDWRAAGMPGPHTVERGVVQAQLAGESGHPVGHWIKLYPYVNAYDTQANSNYFNCSFDPVDDGNTEEDFFDPTDPARSFGPSSTCAPEFVFSQQGETSLPFHPTNLPYFHDTPGLEGDHGPGTWVEPVFDLTRFRGRRIRLRFLTSSLKLGSVVTWENAFSFNPDPRDDGWFIDDIKLTDILECPASVTADLRDNSSLPGCTTICEQVVARVSCSGGSPETSPCASVGAPGQVVTLDAAPSTVDRCVGGTPQIQFWLDADRNGKPDPLVDLLLRGWTDDETLTIAPSGSATYLVEVRCATDFACSDVAHAKIDVACPTGTAGPAGAASNDTSFMSRSPAGGRDVVFASGARLAWPSAATVDVVRGDLDALRAAGTLVGSITACLIDNATDAVDVVDPANPPPGRGLFYLARSADKCNLAAGGSYGGVGEALDRDSAIEGSGTRCLD